jgi:hypothetical protein
MIKITIKIERLESQIISIFETPTNQSINQSFSQNKTNE